MEYFALLQHHSDKKIIDSDTGYGIFRNFAANEWIRRPDIRILRDFAANEWIRRHYCIIGLEESMFKQ